MAGHSERGGGALAPLLVESPRTAATGDIAVPAAQRTVLMITYAYPPNGSPGALRAVKLAKYLPGEGWRPVVVTPQRGYSVVQGLDDEALPEASRIVRTADLAGTAQRILRRGGTGNRPAPRAAGRMRSAILDGARALLFPDRTVGWLPFGAAAAARVAEAEVPSVVHSTSPGMAAHLIGMSIAARYGIPWVAEFRDPWTPSPVYDAPRWRRPLDRALERRFIARATLLVVTSEDHAAMFASAHPDARAKLRVVRNGYDPDDFPAALGQTAVVGPFILTHAGSFYGGARDPGALLAAIASLDASAEIAPERFRLRLIGNPDPAVRARIAEHGVGRYVEEVPAVPYAQVLRLLAESSALLLLTHAQLSSIPVKFYDYLALGKPILALTNPAFELATLVRESGVGRVIERSDVAAIRRWLLEMTARVPAGAPESAAEGARPRFTRQETARGLAVVFAEALASGGPGPWRSDGR